MLCHIQFNEYNHIVLNSLLSKIDDKYFYFSPLNLLTQKLHDTIAAFTSADIAQI